MPSTPWPPQGHDRSPAPRALHIVSLTVKADRVVCEMAITPGFPHNTTPELAERLCARFPDLPAHTCKNPEGDTFAAVMGHTSIPHLLEHLVIDLQAHGSPSQAATFVGTSEWADKDAGLARIEVSFTDDLSALRAFRDGAHILNNALLE